MTRPVRFTQDMIDEYLNRGIWDKRSIVDILMENIAKYPDQEAVVDSEWRLTWTSLHHITDKVAVGLSRMGMKRDQALVAQIPSSANTIILLLACHKAGILTCFPPMTFRHNDMRHLLRTLDAAAVLTPLVYRKADYYKMIKEISSGLPRLKYIMVTDDENPEGTISLKSLFETPIGDAKWQKVLSKRAFNSFEVSIIALSSGTTGMPKCIEHTGVSSKACGMGVVQRSKLTQKDVIGIIAPLSGGVGLQNWWAGFEIGAKVCLLNHFSAEESFQLIEREKVTYLVAIPTQIIKMLREFDTVQFDLSSIRIVRTGAAALDAATAREVEEKMNCTVLISGGSQETYSFAMSSPEDPPEKRLTTIGKPFSGNEIKICDGNGKNLPRETVGHLFVRGATVSSGYYRDVEATLAAWGQFGREGWYKTGDLAKLDSDGYLMLVGREREMIFRAGQNIYPGEIEDLLCGHSNVIEAAVIGVPDPVMGERICACVALAEKKGFSFKEMVYFLKEKGLAIHKLPERLVILEKLPKLADDQKIDRITLKKQVLENIKTDAAPETNP